MQQLTFITEHFDDIVNRKEFLHKLSYEENNKIAELKYEVTKEKKYEKLLTRKRRRLFFDSIDSNDIDKDEDNENEEQE